MGGAVYDDLKANGCGSDGGRPVPREKYLYSLGVNMYGQEIVQRVELDSEGHRVGLLRSVALWNASYYEWRLGL